MVKTRPCAGSATEPATGTAVDAERHVYCPVLARRLAEFAGSIERIDHPHSLMPKALLVVLALLGQDGVVGSERSETGHDQPVGASIAFVAQPALISGIVAGTAQTDEQKAGFTGDLPRNLVIVPGRLIGRRCVCYRLHSSP